MPKLPQAKRLPASRPATRWWAYVLLVVVVALAWPAYRYNVAYLRLTAIQNDMAMGKPLEAIAKLETEYQRSPQSAEITYWLAVAHRRAFHFEKFNELIERAHQLHYPSDEIDRQKLLARFQTGEMEEIEQQGDELIARADNFSGQRFDLFIDEFYEARTEGFLANYRLIDAEVTLTHWIEVRPNSIVPRMRRAQVKEREYNSQAAEREYREILELDPTHIEARIQLARFLLFNQKVSEAAAQFELCLQAVPDDIRVQLGMAESDYRGGGKIDSARLRLESLLKQDLSANDQGNVLFLLGEIARSQDNPQLAIKYLTQATELSSDLGATPYRSLSAIYTRLQQREKAEHYLNLAKRVTNYGSNLSFLANEILQNPTSGELRYEQGKVYFEAGRKDEAAGWWAMALRFDPDHYPARVCLANYYLAKGESDKADYHRSMLARISPKFYDHLWKDLNHDHLAGVREGLPWLVNHSPLKERAELLTLGLAIAESRDLPSSVAGLKRLAEYQQLRLPALTLLGEAHRKMGNYAASRRAFQDALVIDSRDSAVHWGMQKLCRETGSYAEMELHLHKAAELDIVDFRPHRALGDWHKQQQNWSQALLDYQESMRRSPGQVWSSGIRKFEDMQHPKTTFPERDEVVLAVAECQANAKLVDEAMLGIKNLPNSAGKLYVEARCLFASRDLPRATEVLEAAIKLSAEHLPSVLLRTEIALAGEETEVAEKLLSRALSLAPHSSEPHRKFAALLRLKGESAAALAEDKIAVELEALESNLTLLTTKASQNPVDVSPRMELAAVTKKLGRDEEAKHWEAVVKGMLEKSEPIQGAPLPAAAPLVPKLTSAPVGKTTPVKVSTAPVIVDTKSEIIQSPPKSCGEEPAPKERAAPEDEPKTAKEVFSGPQKGEKLPGFKLKTGDDEEKEIDLVKDAEGKPTLIIFVHAVTRPSVGMARVLGEYAATRKKDGLHAGVVFLTADATETKSWLKRAVNALPKGVPLGIAEGGQEGPGAYGLNRNVTMTVLVAKEGKVVANFALVQPSLSADGPKILKEIVDALGGGKVPAIEDLMKRPEPRREPEKKEGKKERMRDEEKSRS